MMSRSQICANPLMVSVGLAAATYVAQFLLEWGLDDVALEFEHKVVTAATVGVASFAAFYACNNRSAGNACVNHPLKVALGLAAVTMTSQLLADYFLELDLSMKHMAAAAAATGIAAGGVFYLCPKGTFATGRFASFPPPFRG